MSENCDQKREVEIISFVKVNNHQANDNLIKHNQQKLS